MLIITRRHHQACDVIHAGERITIRAWIDGGVVRLGFDGPRTFLVVRDDIRSLPAGPAPGGCSGVADGHAEGSAVGAATFDR